MARKYTATYNPYTFEELIKPIDKYNEAYDKLVQQLDDLEVQRSILNKLDPTLDKEAYNLNMAQQTALEQASTEMSSNGLNPTLRATINELRRNQRTTLDPLITAYKEREALIKEQRSKGDNYIFSKDYANTPLTEMLTGTNTYNAYNLEDALKEGMASGKAISSRIYSNPVLARELRDQYFKMANGIDVDGRTVGQLFKDYPELQQDFDAWYEQLEGNYNQDIPARFSEVDLRRAQDRYMSGVLRGIVYSEDYKTNHDHKTPHQIFEEGMASKRLAFELDTKYGPQISTNLGDIHSGDRGQDLGNNVIMIYPKDDSSPSGYGKPYPVDKTTGKKLSDDDATARINRGNFVGNDAITGEKIYNNGKAIIRVDKDTDEIKSIQTVTQEGKVDGSNVNPNNGQVKRYDLFYDFNFDLNTKRGTVKPDWAWGKKSSRHYRSDTKEALQHGYKEVDINTLDRKTQIELLNQINNHFANYQGGKRIEGANLELSDLIILRGPEDEDTGDVHYRVALKSDLNNPQSSGGSGTTVSPGEYNAQISADSTLVQRAANRYGSSNPNKK